MTGNNRIPPSPKPTDTVTPKRQRSPSVKQLAKMRDKIVSDGIHAFMQKCKHEEEYWIRDVHAKAMSFTDNEIYMWNGEMSNDRWNRLDLVGIYSYVLAMEKNEAGELVKAEVHIGKKVPASAQKH